MGETAAGTAWLYRQSEHGDAELVATTPGIPR